MRLIRVKAMRAMRLFRVMEAIKAMRAMRLFRVRPTKARSPQPRPGPNRGRVH